MKSTEDVKIVTQEHTKVNYFFRFFITLFICIIIGIFIIYETFFNNQPDLFKFIFFPILIPILFYGYIRKKIRDEFFKEFAHEHGYSFIETLPSMGEVHSLFLQKIGHNQYREDIVKGKFNNFPITFFTFHTTIGYGRDAHSRELTVAEIECTGEVLDIIIQSTSFHVEESFFAFSGMKQLTLEGDFNKYFSVHIPEGYQIEALEILTPDIMQELKEQSKHFSFEFKENKLFIFALTVITKKTDLDNLFNFAEILTAQLAPVLAKIKEIIKE